MSQTAHGAGLVASAGGVDYLWVDGWVELPDEPSIGHAHTSLALTGAGEIVFGHSTKPELIVAEPKGRVVRRIIVEDVGELHGLDLVEESGVEVLWIADIGEKAYGGSAELELDIRPGGGQVFAIDLEGRRRHELERPVHDAYSESEYSPTSVVVDEPRFGGSGDVWVADGYGASLVHRYDSDGRYLNSLSGEEGAGLFRCPHALLIDRRRDVPELYVADRRNERIQVYDLDGRFKRVVGEGVLVGPTFMAVGGGNLFVTDLVGRRLTILGSDDRFVSHLFAHPTPLEWGAPLDDDGWPDAWPNVRSAEGTTVRPALEPGVFNSPHGVTADRLGNVYVAEWLLGGRPIKLARLY